MKIILISIGTQGDIEPFLAIGELLFEKKHQVICAFPEQFRRLVNQSKLEFYSLGTKFIEMLESNVGKVALGGYGSGFKKMFAYIKLSVKSIPINKQLLHEQYQLIEAENPDRIVFNGKAIYPIIWGLNKKGKIIQVSPVPFLHYVKDHTHVAFNSNYGPFLNKLTFSIANFGMMVTVLISIKWLKLSVRISRNQIHRSLLSYKMIYTISPALFPKADYWRNNIKVLGYPKANESKNRRLNGNLQNFLEKNQNKRILFITFGSMTNPEPEKKTKIIIRILERNKIPAIINTASGGLVKPAKFNSTLLYFVSQIPYDRIFPKIYGVIHHGGSGTTHLALRHGCATMIIPHIIDQFVWNKMIDNIKAGPRGIRIDKINRKNLEPKILDLVYNTSFKKKAEKISSQMEKEDFKEELYKTIVS